jgi:hypothetical protein
MGTLNQGTLGGFSGKVGNTDGIWRKDTNLMHKIPVHAADLKTGAQLNQWMKFAVTVNFLKPLSQFLNIGFKNDVIRMTGTNAAVAYNYHNAIHGTYPDLTINYTKALLSQGNLAMALNTVASSAVANTILFRWDDNSDETEASAFDETLLVIFNSTKNEAVYVTGLSNRAAGNQSVTGPDSFDGDTAQCYISFISINVKDTLLQHLYWVCCCTLTLYNWQGVALSLPFILLY